MILQANTVCLPGAVQVGGIQTHHFVTQNEVDDCFV